MAKKPESEAALEVTEQAETTQLRGVMQTKFAQSVKLGSREETHFSKATGALKQLSASFDPSLGVILRDSRTGKEVIVPLSNVIYMELEPGEQPAHSGDKGAK